MLLTCALFEFDRVCIAVADLHAVLIVCVVFICPWYGEACLSCPLLLAVSHVVYLPDMYFVSLAREACLKEVR